MATNMKEFGLAVTDGPPVELRPEESSPPLVSLRSRLLDIKTLAGFGVSAVVLIIFFLTVKLDLGAIATNIAGANLFYLALAFGIYYGAFWIRGLRWQLLLRGAGFEQEEGVRLLGLNGLVEITYLAWFVNCLVPAKLGDVYRAYLLKKNSRASLSRTLGTLLGERLAEVLVLVVLLGFSGLVAFSGLQGGSSSLILIGGLGLGLLVAILAGLVALRFWGDQIARRLPPRYDPLFRRFREGTLNTFRRDIRLKLYGLTVLVWLCEAVRLYLVIQALHLTGLALPVILFCALASSLLSTIPLTPAGLGAVEGTLVVLLTLFGLNKNLAGSVVILDRVISYWSNLVFGGLLYLVSRKK